MILTQEQKCEFIKITTPVIEFLARYMDPHTKIIVEYDKAEILQSSMGLVDDSFVE